MKLRLVICLLVVGFVSRMDAFVVRNDQEKTVVLTEFVYHVGGSDIPVDRTVTIEQGEAWASNQPENSTGDCTASVGRRVFSLTGLLAVNVVTFYENANGKLKYRVE